MARAKIGYSCSVQERKDFLAELQRIIIRYNEQHILCIVEGKKDVEALRSLGIHEVVELSTDSLFILEKAQSQVIAILTDFDREGRKLYRKILRESSHVGVKVDPSLREFFISRTPLSVIEGISRFINKPNLAPGT
jgi:5S rRNA maturation endonuclease (ribonuclease M5)